MSHQVDIVMRAQGHTQMTQAALKSVRHGTPAGLYKLILVDDGSDAPIGHDLCDAYVLSREPKGAVTATNLGISYALLTSAAPFILVLDNDVTIPDGDQGWLQRMVDWMARDEKTGAVGAVSGYAANHQHALRWVPTYMSDWKNEKDGTSGIKDNPDVPVFVSFCVLLRKTAIAQCGLWDQRYDPGNYEDTDYSLVLREHGWGIKVAQDVYVHHKGSQTFRGNLGPLLRTNHEKFVAKWGAGRLHDMGVAIS